VRVGARLLAVVLFAVSYCLGQSALHHRGRPAPVRKPAPPSPSLVTPEEHASRYLESVRNQPGLLLSFLRGFPKGGDLHNHLIGAIYAESYIQWAVEDGSCIDRRSSAFSPPPCDAEKGMIPAKALLSDPQLYASTLAALSMYEFVPGAESNHDHFFHTFPKFNPIALNHMGEELAEVAARAARQNELYLELIVAPDGGDAARFGSGIGWDPDLKALQQKMLNAGIGHVVATSRSNLDAAEARMRQVLRCGTASPDPGCGVAIRYEFEVPRAFPPQQVFAAILTGFELAAQDPRVVTVNPVMPEDWYVPMRDFSLHMQMFEFLRKQYPHVRLSLHAGELTMGLVPPEGLRFHIHDSIRRGGAQRIGHGVDLPYEDEPLELLHEMAARHVAVEICLTSNELILGVKGDGHPLPLYLQFGVPVVIATDDEGVSRSDMTQEYLRATQTYALKYSDLKRISRNSLEYSFLKGESLWADVAALHRAPACAAENPAAPSGSESCRKWLGANPKAQLQWKLEAAFAHFESQACCGGGAAAKPAK